MLVHSPKSDALVLILTFALTLFCGIVISVNVGIMLSALVLMNRMADSSHIDRVKTGKPVDYDFSQVPEGVAIYAVAGPIFFGMIDKFSKAFSSVKNEDRIVIIRMFDVPFIDATGLQNLGTLNTAFKKRGTLIMLSEANEAVMEKIRKARIMDSTVINSANRPLAEVIDIASKVLGREE
jgi:SulP family sulfate permease